jgi:chromosome segregation ATPase
VANTREDTLAEALAWLEREFARARDEQTKLVAITDQLQRQLIDVLDQVEKNDRMIRAVDPRFAPLKGVPEKLGVLDEATERLRHELATRKAEVDNALRLLQAEAQYDREERAEAVRRISAAVDQLALVAANVAQLQAQVTQASQAASTIIERQREVEDRVHQFGLRLDRSIEVHRDLEERVRAAVLQGIEERFAIVFERLQLVGEMVQRTERIVEKVSQERTLRQEVLEQVGLWRDEHTRLESRVAAVEEIADRVLTEVDKVRGEIALLEGRHAGLGERVASIRRDIAEVVDHVRDEFAKYNQMTEKQRRKQIQVLEQELREMKFHAFRPPEEP